MLTTTGGPKQWFSVGSPNEWFKTPIPFLSLKPEAAGGDARQGNGESNSIAELCSSVLRVYFETMVTCEYNEERKNRFGISKTYGCDLKKRAHGDVHRTKRTMKTK